MTTAPARVLGDLDRNRFQPISVRDEIRRNLLARLASGDTLFQGIVGYDDSVVPQVVNALLARHDLIFLGLRGQAKTRLCRMVADLLDDEMPIIAGSPLREHPLQPITAASRQLVAEAGDDLELEWVPRSERYGEKLATPDVSVADLIGDVDPLKAAHRKLTLDDEAAIHWGIVPRSNHGVFCINEIPDLAPRIQVALLNLLEEQDLQIRGFPLRVPLDVVMLFTANPEDYTNRGSIITPLKDRIASQVTTHYPKTLAEARSISADQAWTTRDDQAVQVPDFLADVVEEIAFRGRESEYIDQKSGVSARLAIAAHELLISQVERRAAVVPGSQPNARLVDLWQLAPAITGKVELVYEGEQEGPAQVAVHLISHACREVFERHFPAAITSDEDPSPADDTYNDLLAWFAGGKGVDLQDDTDDATYQAALDQVPGLSALVAKHLPEATGPAAYAAMELVLEGLHQASLLSKLNLTSGVSYGDMLRAMLDDTRLV